MTPPDQSRSTAARRSTAQGRRAGAHGTTRALATVAWLRDRIASGEWPVDSQIPTEQQLIDAIGVGRSTVREAVRTLANQGMLETAPGRGTFVRSRTPVSGVIADHLGAQDLRDLLELRTALETQAAASLADRRRDADLDRLRSALAATAGAAGAWTASAPSSFDAELVLLADNGLLADIHRSVLGALQRHVETGRLRLAPLDQRLADRRELLVALVDADAAAARALTAAQCARDLERTPRPGAGARA